MTITQNKNISNITYSTVNIENKEYWNCVFYRVTFLHIKFKKCYFNNCIFKECQFKACDFFECSFQIAEFISSFISSSNPNITFSATHFYCTDIKVKNTKNINLNHCSAYEITAPNEILPYLFPLACPETGSFIAYKAAQIVTFDKISNDLLCDSNNCFISSTTPVIIKLLIPEDAKRSSSQTRKCRASKAKVLEITDLSGNQYTSAESLLYPCLYKLNETIEAKNFNEDRWRECAEGIHFFLTKEEAINYCSEHISFTPTIQQIGKEN